MRCPICGQMLDYKSVEDPELGVVEASGSCPSDCYVEEFAFGASRIYVGEKTFDFGTGEETDRIGQLVQEAVSIFRQSKVIEG